MRASASLAGLALLAAVELPRNPGVEYVDQAAAAGLAFRHQNAASSSKYIIETMGSGVGTIDFDGDGYLDLFLVQGGETPAFRPAARLKHALFRNNRDGTFAEVTDRAGVGGDGSFGMGMAAGDYDGDGFTDLYVTGYPRSMLYRNAGNGAFQDVTGRAGVAGEGAFSTSAGWFDFDNDGRLDLLVLRYMSWSWESEIRCGGEQPERRTYCDPIHYPGASPALYRNNGDGAFTDVTRQAGLWNPDGKGLGLALADFNNDSWTDIFIANDGTPSKLYFNRKNGTFEDRSIEAGVGYTEDGAAEAGMGVDAADYDRDGWLDLFVTHLDHQLHRLFRNNRNETFQDATVPAGLGGLNLLSGFGCKFLDLDADGWPDLFSANGHVLDNIHSYRSQVRYAEPKRVYWNLGNGKFRDVTSQVGAAASEPRVSRGLAVADLDNDGRLEIVVSNNGGPPELYRNRRPLRNQYVILKLVGRKANRDAIGARLTIQAGDHRATDQVKGGASYLGTGDLRAYFGLGSRRSVDRAEVTWPGGRRELWRGLAAGKIHTLIEGQGRAPETP